MKETSADVPCCVEGPADFVPKAQYALQMLLIPLGINPVWCARASIAEGGIYYGNEPAGLAPAVLQLPLAPATPQYFETKTRYDTSGVHWQEAADERFPVLFGGPEPDTFDYVASAFFWLSGWQEYTIQNRDRHGRFSWADSMQAVLDTVYTPVVDCYRAVLRRQLLQHGIPVRERTWAGKTWAFCPTHDIDYIWKWRPGMVYREVVEYGLLNRRHVGVGARVKRLGAFIADALKPGDIFRQSLDRMIDEVHKRGGKATYFFKTGAHGPHDVYYAPSNGYLRRTLKRLAQLGFEVGLHPSYYAHTHPDYMQEEKAALADITSQPLVSVRQHYLRYTYPHTMRLQEAAGFTVDSTLGFSDHEGFRHGTCHPFLRYDILKNKSTTVWEVPLCFMDGTLFNYRNMGFEEALAAAQTLILTCKKHGGVCVGLWHNMLWDEMDFPGWGAHFEQTLDFVVKEQGEITTLQDVCQE
ncbi:MAG: polysaccharide deacetylase family protein [Bacteroidota bacterium]